MRAICALLIALSAAGGTRAQSAADADQAAHDRAVTRHMLRLQQARFEARNRGEPKARLDALARELRHAQQRWLQNHPVSAPPAAE
jgi:hypothetical protein